MGVVVSSHPSAWGSSEIGVDWCLSLHPLQPGSKQPPLGTIPLFNPAEISQVRASFWAAA